MKTQRAGPKCCLGVVPQNSARMFSNPAPILRKPLVKELLQANNGRTVIELGAGCLRNALHLQELGFGVSVLEVVGMEERFPSQYRAFRRVGGRVLKTLPRLGRFDFSLATFVIETICNSQHRSELIIRVRRSLRPGGFLIMSVRGPRDLLTAHNTGVPCSDWVSNFQPDVFQVVHPATTRAVSTHLRVQALAFSAQEENERTRTSSGCCLEMIENKGKQRTV